MPDSFFDTNVLMYLGRSIDSAKADRAEQMMAVGGTISVQVLNEMTNVARRKMRLSWSETSSLLGLVRRLLCVVPMTVETHETGLGLAERYGMSIYDSMIVASALLSDCTTLWSEDMQHGMVIQGRLRIADPFRPA